MPWRLSGRIQATIRRVVHRCRWVLVVPRVDETGDSHVMNDTAPTNADHALDLVLEGGGVKGIGLVGAGADAVADAGGTGSRASPARAWRELVRR